MHDSAYNNHNHNNNLRYERDLRETGNSSHAR